MIKQVVLYVKLNGGPWQKHHVADATQRFFDFQAPRDGEYAFSVVTIDRRGNATPADVNQEPPKLTLVVDTQPPALVATPMRMPNGQNAVRCCITDRSPDYNKLFLTLHSGQSAPLALQRVAGSNNLFLLPAAFAFGGEIRCKATDAAGNVRTQSFAVNRLFPASATAKKSRTGEVTPVSKQTQISQRPNLQTLNSPAPPPLPPSGLGQQHHPEGATKPAPLPPPKEDAGRFDSHNKNPGPLPPPNRFPMTNKAAPINMPLPPSSASAAPKIPSPNAGNLPLPNRSGNTHNPTVKQSGNRHLLATTRASIQYRIDKLGASGVSKVDVYVKAENSPSWKHVGVDHDRTSPAEVILPGDGVYGVRLVVTNGHGIGGKPPASHEEPDFYIEVDSTPPFAKLHPIDPLTGSGGIEIRWTANDLNLGNEAVSLYYANAQQGPWFPIAQRHKNSGNHLWQFPRDRGAQFFVKLEVTDIAGNKSTDVTQSPVMLDMTRPRVSVVGVVGLAPTTQSGHRPELPR